MFKTTRVQVHPEDQKILETIAELYRELSILKIRPKTVSWVDRWGFRKIPFEQILFLRDSVLISTTLMGKLSANEWKPLLASSLIYHMKMQRKMATGVILRIVPAMGVPLAGIFILDRVLGFNTFWVIFVLLQAMVVLLLISQVSFYRYMKRLWLKADLQATQISGKDNMLAALTRLESVQTETGQRLPRLYGKPSITARLENIRSQIP